MKRILILLAMLACAGCQTAPKYVVPPSTSELRTAIADGKVATAQGRAAAKVARAAVADAQKRTEQLLKNAPPDLRPLLEELKEKLAVAQQEAAIFENKAQETEVAFQNAQERVTILEADSAKLAESCRIAQDQAEKYNAARKIAEAEKAKWVLLFWGGVGLVAAFFVARQYCPFLKFL